NPLAGLRVNQSVDTCKIFRVNNFVTRHLIGIIVTRHVIKIRLQGAGFCQCFAQENARVVAEAGIGI
ncbi:MAG: hypothetical protein IRA32_10680, partial [Xanthomonas citri pv. citri]